MKKNLDIAFSSASTAVDFVSASDSDSDEIELSTGAGAAIFRESSDNG